MGKLIDGLKIAKKIRKETLKKVKTLKKQGIVPKLAVVLVGKNKPSQTYVKKKEQAAKSAGIDFKLHKIDAKITTKELLKKIETIQQDKALTGIIVQLPLPRHIDTKTILNAVRPEIDADCLTDINQNKLLTGQNTVMPPTPAAIMRALQELKINPAKKNVVIIGKGALVGKPLAIIMKKAGAKVTVCDSKTPDIKEKCLQADIIATGVGKKDVLRGDMVKNGAIVLDAGACFVNGKLYGDVNVKEALKKVAYVTPTPAGIGPITVELLLWNVVKNAELRM